MKLVAGVVLSLALALAVVTPAAADGGASCNQITHVCKAAAKSPGKKSHSKPKPSSGGGASTIITNRSGSKGDQKKAARATEKQVAEDTVRFQNEQLAYQRCLSVNSIGGNRNCNAPKAVAQVTGQIATTPQANATIVTITPEQAAYMALAQLRLPTTPPAVGPDPDKNEWHMAAVGYPLWLWADGPTHVGPVASNVANLSVSLDARVSKTLFKMGDGHSVTCRGGGTPYKSWTKPGAKSPSCGYTYEKPSLPQGNYAVTAVTYWAVTWRVGGATGVINLPQQASTQLPVGELEAIVIR